jgi:hypothetical protein
MPPPYRASHNQSAVPVTMPLTLRKLTMIPDERMRHLTFSGVGFSTGVWKQSTKYVACRDSRSGHGTCGSQSLTLQRINQQPFSS